MKLQRTLKTQMDKEAGAKPSGNAGIAASVKRNTSGLA